MTDGFDRAQAHYEQPPDDPECPQCGAPVEVIGGVEICTEEHCDWAIGLHPDPDDQLDAMRDNDELWQRW